MLNNIHINNFAIIDQLDLDFKQGLTALTGETGAGKSILLGALGLLLGDRADSDNVRDGSNKSEISAEFDINNLKHVIQWLQKKDLDSDQDCVLRRRLSSDGRSRAFINGTPVPLQDIRELGEMLVDIHGQHEHQSLMKPKMQRQLLDDYAKHKKQLDELSTVYQQWSEANKKYQLLKNATDDRNNRLELLRYQVQELDELNLTEGEFQKLIAEHSRLANSDRLMETSQKSLQLIYESDESNIYSQLSKQVNELEALSELDTKLTPTHTMLSEAMIQLEETASHLRDYLSQLENDPDKFKALDNRLSLIHELSRKHQIESEKLHLTHQSLKQELDQLDHADTNLIELEKQSHDLDIQYRDLANALTQSRIKSATKLNKKVTQAMQTLGMQGGSFNIIVQQNPDTKFSATGFDIIEFTVSTNKGHSCKSLAKIASGGELARISLAIQMMTAQQGRIPTLIFDEVDSGVGGGIAEIVGRHLRELGDSKQCFCVTHLPQVASQAHHHMQVEKSSNKSATHTQIKTLDDKQRVEEISRMLGGIEITKQTRAHAREMLNKSSV